MLNRIDERNLPSFVEKSAKKKDSSFVNGNVPRDLIDKVYAIKEKYRNFGSARIYKLKNNTSAAKFFFDKISKAKESRGGKYGWAVELKSVDSYANKDEDSKMRLFVLDSGNSGFAITSNGTLVSVFTHKDADKNDINMILAMAVEYGADKLDCYTAKNKLTDLYSKFGFKETGRTAFNYEYAPEDAPDYVKNDEFEGSTLPKNQGNPNLRPADERPDVAFMHRPQHAPKTGSSVLRSKDKHTNYNKQRKTTPSAIGGEYPEEEVRNKNAASKSKVRGRQTHLQRDWMNQSVSFDAMVKDVLGESSITRSIRTVMNESKDIITITTNDLYEWLMEIGNNSMIDDFKPHQIKAVIEMMLRSGDELPEDDDEMANWVRKNEDDLIENLARATGAYFMSREEFAKKQEEEESPLPKIVAKGTEVLYNKRGRAFGIKVSIQGQGVLYMKRKGSTWEILDVSKESDSDPRVWEVVEKSLKKMAEKEPTRFIRFMRNRAYELPSWKQTVVGESITVKGIEVTLEDIMWRAHDATEEQILSWMKNNDGVDYNRFPDLIQDVEDTRPRQEKLKDAYEIVMDVLSDWLNFDARTPEIKNIVISNLKEVNPIPTNLKDIRKFIGRFWGKIKHLKQQKI